MSVKRNRPKGARFALFGLGLCAFALTPTEVGYQDIASLLARQPGVAERWQKRVFSAASTIQVATYSFGRPIGTSTPQSVTYRLANLDNQGIDITGSVTRNPIAQPALPRYQASDFPKVDRALKGDRLVTAAPAAPAARPALDPELQEALSAPPLPQYDVSMSLEAQPLDDLKVAPDAAVIALEPAPSHDGFNVKTASLFFGSPSLGGSIESMERWRPGEEPSIVALPDPDMKILASLPSAADEPSRAVES